MADITDIIFICMYKGVVFVVLFILVGIAFALGCVDEKRGRFGQPVECHGYVAPCGNGYGWETIRSNVDAGWIFSTKKTELQQVDGSWFQIFPKNSIDQRDMAELGAYCSIKRNSWKNQIADTNEGNI